MNRIVNWLRRIKLEILIMAAEYWHAVVARSVMEVDTDLSEEDFRRAVYRVEVALHRLDQISAEVESLQKKIDKSRV